MKNILKKTGRFVIQGALSVLAFALVLFVLMHVVLLVGINALNMGKGHDFILAQLQKGLSSSGYQANFEHLFYDPVRGFTVTGFSLSDQGGPVAMVDSLSLNINFLKLPLRSLEFSIAGGQMSLIRLPKETEKEEIAKAPMQPFKTPDVFVRSITLTFLSFDKILVGEKIAGTAISLSPILKANIDMRDEIHAKMAFKPHLSVDENKIYSDMMPDSLYYEGIFAPRTLTLTTEQASVNAAQYIAEAQGSVSFAQDGRIDMTITANHTDLRRLSGDQVASAALHATAGGATSSPDLLLDGVVKFAQLADKGLSDLHIQSSLEHKDSGWAAQVNMDSAYQENPVKLASNLLYTETALLIKTLEASASGLSIIGNGSLETASGLFTGETDLHIDDLSQYNKLANASLTGDIRTNISLMPLEGIQTASIDAKANGLGFENYKIRSAAVKARIPDVMSPWPQTANIQILNASIGKDMSISKASAVLEKNANDQYVMTLSGTASLPAPVSWKGDMVVANVAAPFPSLEDIALNLFSGTSKATLGGGFGPGGIDLKASTKNFRLADLPGVATGSVPKAALSATIVMTGPTNAPQTDGEFLLSGVNAGQYKLGNIAAKLIHKDGSAEVSVSGKGSGIRTLSGKATAPVELSIYPFSFSMPDTGALSGSLDADLDLSPFGALFLNPAQRLSGGLVTTGVIGGTIAAPQIKANATLRNAAFEDEQNGIILNAMNGKASYADDTITLSDFSATDGQAGRLRAKGTLGLSGKKSANASLSMSHFQIPQTDTAKGDVSADLSIKDAADGYLAAGKITVSKMDIVIPERLQSNIPQLNIVQAKQAKGPSMADRIMLRIMLDAPNQFFVRGWGLDAEFGGSLDIGGTASAPAIDGTLSSKRGRYEEFGKRFALEKADLRFQGAVPPSPYLDINATTQTSDVEASILLTGPVQKPSINFASTPSLPEDEVLSRILFDKESSNISPFQAIQLAQTVQRFSGNGGGGFDPVATLRSVTGLDDLSVETGDDGAASVGAGKYLTDNVYLEVEKGQAENSGAASIQIEVSPSINVQSKIGQDAQAGGGIYWKRDY